MIVFPATLASHKAGAVAGSIGVVFAFLFAVDWTPIAVGFLGLVQASMVAWFGTRQARNDRRALEAKTRAEMAASETRLRHDRSDRLIDQLQEQLTATNNRLTLEVEQKDALSARVHELDQALRELERKLFDYQLGTQRLRSQLHENNIEPAWDPPKPS